MRATWDHVLSLRARRHFLTGPVASGAVQVARRLGGIHAQVASSAALAIGIRTHGTLPVDVRRAVEFDHRLVKTWTLRSGTLHLVAADDLPQWVAALRTRQSQFRPGFLRYFGISADDADAIFKAIPRALDGRCLTREDLAREVARLTFTLVARLRALGLLRPVGLSVPRPAGATAPGC